MPRIRNFKHLKYYRPVTASGVLFKHIDSLFTNDKSEEFNNFIDWLAFGHDGAIEDNLQGIQKKIINFGRLAANAVILHVVANMTNVINDMKTEGYEISPEMLNSLSPYHTGHLNRFGLFPLTGDREKLRVEFKLN